MRIKKRAEPAARGPRPRWARVCPWACRPGAASRLRARRGRPRSAPTRKGPRSGPSTPASSRASPLGPSPLRASSLKRSLGSLWPCATRSRGRWRRPRASAGLPRPRPRPRGSALRRARSREGHAAGTASAAHPILRPRRRLGTPPGHGPSNRHVRQLGGCPLHSRIL